jgi:cell division protein FtsZ
MEEAGSALMGMGVSSGENRAEEAAKIAINSPLLDISINGAKGVLFSIAGGDDLTMYEIQEAAKIITESTDPDARVIFGTIRDENLKKGEVKVTIIASGFPDGGMGMQKKSLFGGEREEKSEGVIENNIDSSKKEPKKKVKEEEEKDKGNDNDDDEWGAVPAFLRRSKIK